MEPELRTNASYIAAATRGRQWGVSSDVAVGSVLDHRLISHYLPPTWGWVSLRWLQKHDYL